MNRRSLVVLILSLVGAAGCKSSSGTKPPEAPPPGGAVEAEPFPPGFDYPMSAEALAKAIAARDSQVLRRHGWYLFAGINKPASNEMPIWRTWPTSTPAYAPQGLTSARSPQRARSLIQVNKDNTRVTLDVPLYPVPSQVCQEFYSASECPQQLPDGVTFQSNGDIMIAGVIYNEDAFQWIRGTGGSPQLFEASVLTGMLPPPQQFRQIPAFPARSFVLKHMYWPVPGDACGALPVWDNPPPPTPSTYMGYETWPRASTGLTPSSSYQLSPIQDDPGLLTNLQPDNPIFQSLLLLDFQWAISDRAIPLDYTAPAQNK